MRSTNKGSTSAVVRSLLRDVDKYIFHQDWVRGRALEGLGTWRGASSTQKIKCLVKDVIIKWIEGK